MSVFVSQMFVVMLLCFCLGGFILQEVRGIMGSKICTTFAEVGPKSHAKDGLMVVQMDVVLLMV